MKTVFWVFTVVLCVAGAGLSQQQSVSWDGASADITGQAANVNSIPGAWVAADAVWGTTDEVVPVVGSQASFKAAIAQAGIAQRAIAQLNAGGDTVFVGGEVQMPKVLLVMLLHPGRTSLGLTQPLSMTILRCPRFP